ncbi:DsrE family protein [Sulfuriferula sp. GW1]|uniref:DsrE family protein n=1 Tax=Sulfuriferula sp. GW1 TaxID=3345111 RepID=UPI0039AFD2AB
MRHFIRSMILLLVFSCGAAIAHTATTTSEHAKAAGFKVLLEVNSADPVTWHNAVNNATQIMQVVGMDKAQVEVVAWGAGIKMLAKGSPVAEHVQSLSDYGVSFVACGNTMKALHMSPKDLIAGVKVVPGAIGEIVKRDHEGWTQIKM